MRRKTFFTVLMLAVLAVASGGKAFAQMSMVAQEEQMAKVSKGQKVKPKAYRGSAISYMHYGSVLAPSDFDRVYGMNIAFRPRYHLNKTMMLGANLGVDLELTDSNISTYKREPLLSDLFLMYIWRLGKIPVLDVGVMFNAMVRLPTSKISQARSMVMSLRPMLLLNRRFTLSRGTFFKSLTLVYGFGATKFLNEYTTVQLDDIGGCEGSTNPGCAHVGTPNLNWVLQNIMTAILQVHPKVMLTLSLVASSVYIYGHDATTYNQGNINLELPESASSNRTFVSGGLDVTVPVARWLWLSAGLSSFTNQLKPDQSFRLPILNPFTTFYFSATVPIDGLVQRFGG